jgi:hypothetical protein
MHPSLSPPNTQTHAPLPLPPQRFATYSHLKQLVLRMITEDMRQRGTAPTLAAALQVGARPRRAPALGSTWALQSSRCFSVPTPLRRHSPSQDDLARMSPPLPPRPPSLRPPTPQDLFAEYDVDASGSISFDELATGLQRQGYVINESEVGAAVPQGGWGLGLGPMQHGRLLAPACTPFP